MAKSNVMIEESKPPVNTVRLPKSRGAVACGHYKAGEVYQVEAAEAERLVKAKGFEYVTAADLPQTGEE